MCLGTVLPGTVDGYASHLRKYSRFCFKKGLNPAADVVIEKYLFHLFKSNADMSAAFQFRPALRKAAKTSGLPDPMPNGSRLSVMVNTFSHDVKLRIVKCLAPHKLSALLQVFSSLKSVRDNQAALLFSLSLAQGLRITSVCDCRFNDFFPQESLIYIHHAKGHCGPIFTILHPEAYDVLLAFKVMFPKANQADKLSEGWDKASLNAWLADCCIKAGIDIITWHSSRHTFAQFLNDLNYPSALMQALGTWKSKISQKSYVRVRDPFQFPPEVMARHKLYIEKLSSILRRQKGRMLWFSSSSS
jgi:integrase